MKNILFSALLPVLAIGARAQQDFQLPALLVEEGGGHSQVWVTAATKTSFRYKTTEVSTSTTDGRFSGIASLVFLEPALLAKGIEQFEARKYAEAKETFATVKNACKPVLAAPGNPGTLAAYHEMECMRRLGDLAGLSAALKDFVKDPLLDESQLRQLELYVMWDAVRTESWDRLAILANERAGGRLSPGHRAQVAFCAGLAAEKLGKTPEALASYAAAMTADAGASDHASGEAALRVLAIHSADEGVKKAIRSWGSEDENKNSQGYADLVEAAAVADLYQTSLGGGKALPSEYKKLLEYRGKKETRGES